MELETFKQVVVPLRGKLTHISLKLVDQTDAEDIVQEAFLRLWQMRDRLDEYASVEALAITITKNLSLDKLKTDRPEAGEEPLLQMPGGRTPEQMLEQKDAVACVRQLIEHLPYLQQTIIRMKDVEGYELSEIAEITGTPVETARVYLSRARKKVREQFLQLNR